MSGNPQRNFGVPLARVVPMFDFPCKVDLGKTEELPSYDDRNFRVLEEEGEESQGRSWVVKCFNADFISEDRVRLQVDAMRSLHDAGVPVPAVLSAKGGEDVMAVYTPCDEDRRAAVAMEEGVEVFPNGAPLQKCLVQVIDFVPESVLYPPHAARSPAFLRHLGSICGDVQWGMRGFFEAKPELEQVADFTWDWNCNEIPRSVSSRLHLVGDEAQRERARTLLERVKPVLPVDRRNFEELAKEWEAEHTGRPGWAQDALRMNPFVRSFIHSDLNDTNILFGVCDLERDAYEHSAVLDFGDACLDFRPFELGVASGYAGMDQPGCPLDTIAQVCRGYVEFVARKCMDPEEGCFSEALFDSFLPPEALKAVYCSSLGRQLLSWIMGYEQMLLNPGDEYLAHSVEPMWRAAEKHLEAEVPEGLDEIVCEIRRRAVGDFEGRALACRSMAGWVKWLLRGGRSL